MTSTRCMICGAVNALRWHVGTGRRLCLRCYNKAERDAKRKGAGARVVAGLIVAGLILGGLGRPVAATWLPPGGAVPTPTGWGACASIYRYRLDFPHSYMIGFCTARYPDWDWTGPIPPTSHVEAKGPGPMPPAEPTPTLDGVVNLPVYAPASQGVCESVYAEKDMEHGIELAYMIKMCKAEYPDWNWDTITEVEPF